MDFACRGGLETRLSSEVRGVQSPPGGTMESALGTHPASAGLPWVLRWGIIEKGAGTLEGRPCLGIIPGDRVRSQWAHPRTLSPRVPLPISPAGWRGTKGENKLRAIFSLFPRGWQFPCKRLPRVPATWKMAPNTQIRERHVFSSETLLT